MEKTQEIQDKLMALREQIEDKLVKIQQAENSLSEAKQDINRIIGEYNGERVRLIKQKLISSKIIWCTKCFEIISQKKAKLVFITGKEKYSHGYEGSMYGFQSFSKLHRVCPSCNKRFSVVHGRVGEYDSMARDQESFYAFRVIKGKDGYYANKFGKWAKLEEKNCQLADLPESLIEKLATEWNYPPKTC